MIQAIIFDCFGVFYVDPVFEYMHDPNSPAETARALHELDKRAARGEVMRAEFNEQASALLGITPALADQRFFQATARNQRLVDYAQSLRAWYKIALLSNIGADMMDEFFGPSEREQLFDVVVLSGAVRLAKPDPEIFRLTGRRLGVELAAAVMIDDSSSNCEAARGLGMAAIQYTSFAQTKAELEQLLGQSQSH